MDGKLLLDEELKSYNVGQKIRGVPSHPLSENIRHSFPENGKWMPLLFQDKGRCLRKKERPRKENMTYNEAEAYIKKVYDQPIRLGLERMVLLLEKLGNPQKQLKFIHVAGTNGKGSVCAMTAQILQCAGFQTGLFTSPVIFDYREQFQINGEMINKEEFIALTKMLKKACDEMQDPPSEFEKTVALAFLYFAEHDCDLVVLEVGLGGTDDATNVIDTPEVATIVNIDFDHMGFLGSTLAEIAEKKAGIIKKNSLVVTVDQKEEVLTVLRARCAKMHAKLFQTTAADTRVKEKSLDGQYVDYVKKTETQECVIENLSLSLIGDHQCENAAAVLEIIHCLRTKGYRISDDAIREGLCTVRWPGRFEVVKKSPLMIVDGAHNPDGIAALSHNLNTYCQGEKFVFITGILKDKDYNEMLEQMLPYADGFVTISPDNPRAMSETECADAIRTCGFKGEVIVSIDKEQAVKQALQLAKSKNAGVCAFGSLYSVGALKAVIEDLP